MTNKLAKLEPIFTDLIDQEVEEAAYQDFLEDHPQFIPREFIQNHGLHWNVVLRKLRLGADYQTDFFYVSKSSSDWHAVFIEIEKPQSRYFSSSGLDFHPDFIAALDQIQRWKAWLSSADNFRHFRNVIDPLLKPINMSRNRIFPRFVLVHGRRSEFLENQQRQQRLRTSEDEDFKILSYDSLLDGARHNPGLYVARRRNEWCEILSDEYVDDMLFVWADPTQWRISRRLRQAVEESRDKWFGRKNYKGDKLLDERLDDFEVFE